LQRNRTENSKGKKSRKNGNLKFFDSGGKVYLIPFHINHFPLQSTQLVKKELHLKKVIVKSAYKVLRREIKRKYSRQINVARQP